MCTLTTHIKILAILWGGLRVGRDEWGNFPLRESGERRVREGRREKATSFYSLVAASSGREATLSARLELRDIGLIMANYEIGLSVSQAGANT